jgi:hypothetical protein
MASGTNKMTPGNIATVVGPNIMRSKVESDNPIVMMEEMKTGHKFTELLILENMNQSLSAKMAVGEGSTRMAAVYRRSFARGSEASPPAEAQAFISSSIASDANTALSVLDADEAPINVSDEPVKTSTEATEEPNPVTNDKVANVSSDSTEAISAAPDSDPSAAAASDSASTGLSEIEIKAEFPSQSVDAPSDGKQL